MKTLGLLLGVYLIIGLILFLVLYIREKYVLDDFSIFERGIFPGILAMLGSIAMWPIVAAFQLEHSISYRQTTKQDKDI